MQLDSTRMVTYLFNRAADSAVANVGIDLAEKVAPNHCGLQLQMLLVGGNNSTPPGHLSHDLKVTSQLSSPLTGM